MLATVVPIAVIAWVITLDPITAGILALTVPLLILFMVLIGKGARAQAQRRWRALALLGAHFLDVVQGLATLRAYGREDAQEQTLADVGERYRTETMATLRTAFLSAFVLELCAMIGTALVAATIGVQLVSGTLSLQAGLTVLLLAPEMYGPLRQVGQQFHASTDATTAYERIFQALEESPPIARRAPPASRISQATPICFEAVSYRYPQRAGSVLSNVELELEPGRHGAARGERSGQEHDRAAADAACRPDRGGHHLCAASTCATSTPSVGGNRSHGCPSAPPSSPRRSHRTSRSAGQAPLPSRYGRPRIAPEPSSSTGSHTASIPRWGRAGGDSPPARRSASRLHERSSPKRPLLLLDEPTAHLDDESAQTIGETIRELAYERTTLLIVHHPLLTELADQLHVIHDGHVAVGQADQTLLAPAAGQALVAV